MKGWLIYGRDDAQRNLDYIKQYQIEGEKRGVEIYLVLVEDLLWGFKGGQAFLHRSGTRTEKMPDFVICRHVNPILTEHFEILRIPIFNNSLVAKICNDKQKTHQFLSQHDIPMVDTLFGNRKCIPAGEGIPYPAVVKPVDGHGGNKVFLVRNPQEYQSAISEILPRNFLVQKYAESEGRDLRVYVIGKELIASVLRRSTEGFRSNYSLGGTVEQYVLSKKERILAEKVIKLFDFGMVGIDFLWDMERFCVNELEDVAGARMLYTVSDINIAAQYLDFILKSIKKRSAFNK